LKTPFDLTEEAAAATGLSEVDAPSCWVLEAHCVCMEANMSYRGMNSMGGSTWPPRICRATTLFVRRRQ